MKTPIQRFYDFLEQNQYFVDNVLYARYRELIKEEKEIICQVYIDGFTLDYDQKNFDPYNDIGYKAWSEYYFNSKFNDE